MVEARVNRRAEQLRLRILRGRRSPWWTAGFASLALHGAGGVGLSKVGSPVPERGEEKVITVALVSRGAEQTQDESSAPEPPEPTVAEAELPQPSPTPTPTPPAPQPAPAPPMPSAPVGSAPLPSVPQSFASFRQSRFSSFLSPNLQLGGRLDGTDRFSNESRDRCTPFPNRRLDRLYLLFDTSGSMSHRLEAQALRCAQQYARAAIDGGATVVVGNFARSTTLFAPTRSMIDVSVALRAENDHTATALPSTELYRYFDHEPGLTADLVILSDGHIPNLGSVSSSYRYFLELNPDNRGYLYTLGTRGHPGVNAALRDIGFDVYQYRIF